MEKIVNETHPEEAIGYSISRILERGGYYGFRSLIVLYMMSEVIKMEEMEAIEIYGLLGFSIVISKILGAILGDLLLGNRTAIIIGGLIQSIGMFSFCIPSTTGLYIGLFLVVLGTGLYSPNLISNFGKLYLNRAKLLDSGFTIFYFIINIGSFLGVLSIGYIGETYGWNVGFILSGLIMLCSVIPILLSKNKEVEYIQEIRTKPKRSSIKIVIAFVSVGMFWAIYELANYRVFDLQLLLSEVSTLGIPKSLWSSLNSMFTIPISLIAIFTWTYFYSSQIFKLMIGFAFGAISFGILFMIPEVPDEKHTFLYLISILFLGVSEIHIAPIIYSILTQYTNPKYLAILIGLSFIPIKLFSVIIGLFNEKLLEKPTTAVLIAAILMAVFSSLLFKYNQNRKKKFSNLSGF